jgi:Holliday junction resolvase-like predicted endonuclease
MTTEELRDFIANLSIEVKELRDSQKEFQKVQKQTDEQLKQTDKQLKQTDEKLARVGITVGNMSNNQGAVAEEYFINSLRDNPKIGDISFDIVDSNTKRHIGKLQDEFDIILINGNSVAIIEVKYKVHPKDVERLKQKIFNFKKLFPVYKDYKLYAGIAGFVVPKDAFDIAKNNGYFVLQRKGDVIQSFTDGLKVA